MDYLISFIPDWVFYLTIFGFALGMILSKTPSLDKYGNVIIPIGLMFIIVSVYLLTNRINNEKWESRFAGAESQIAILKQKTSEVNEKVIEYIEVPVKEIITQNNTIKEQIPVYITNENDCSLPPEAIMLYNKSINIPKQ